MSQHIYCKKFSDSSTTLASDGNPLTLQPGTAAFNNAYDQIIDNPDVNEGSKFVDQTKMYVGEGNYNFRSLLKDYMDLQVGGSYRQYSLNSDGTIFTDYDGPIEYGELGAYVQGSKKFLAEERLKLTASIRVDKNDFFDAKFSPRVSLNYSAGDQKQHNIRGSFQTGFRNPDTQALFIGFDVGRAILVGSSPDNLDRNLPGTDLTGQDAYFDSYTRTSVEAFAATGDITLLEAVVTPLVQQEKVTAFDIGYRGKIGPINLDANLYYNMYDGFINQQIVITPENGSTSDATGIADIVTGQYEAFQLYTNSTEQIKSYGFVVGGNFKFAKNFVFGVNYTYAKFDFDQEKEPDFSAGFNTPENQVKISIGNSNLFKNFGFNIDGRYKGSYLWESSIANAVMPEIYVVDAQINYGIPAIKSVIKAGATNLGGIEYQSAVGTGYIGSQYYISLTINN